MLDVSMLTLDIGRWTVGTLGRWDVGTLTLKPSDHTMGYFCNHVRSEKKSAAVRASPVYKTWGLPLRSARGHSLNQDGSSSDPWLKGSLPAGRHMSTGPSFFATKKVCLWHGQLEHLKLCIRETVQLGLVSRLPSCITFPPSR